MNAISDGLSVVEAEAVSICSIEVGGRMFGIDTRSIREVLGKRRLQSVPLAPAFIGGMVPYRGEVLTTVSLRALLGMEEREDESCVLVLDGDEAGEWIGLMVDRVGGVVMVEQAEHTANPSTLDAVSRELFDGAYRMRTGLLVQLNHENLKPGRLAASGIFVGSRKKEAGCAR